MNNCIAITQTNKIFAFHFSSRNIKSGQICHRGLRTGYFYFHRTDLPLSILALIR